MESRNVRLISERLSVSDEVCSVAEMIFNDAEKNYSKYPSSKKSDGFFVRRGTEKYTLWGYDVTVDLTVYDFLNRTVFNQNINSIQLINSFDCDTLTLTITVAMLNGVAYRRGFDDSVYHEVEHLYQWCMNKKSNPNFRRLVDDAYNYAQGILSNGKNRIERNIAWAFYYSNHREQDAFMHEYYKQATNSYRDFKLGMTEVDKRFEMFQYYVEWLKNNIDNPSLSSYFKPYFEKGYDKKNFLKYVDNGLKRFHNKMEHVKKLVETSTFKKMPLEQNEAKRIAKRVIETLRNSFSD